METLLDLETELVEDSTGRKYSARAIGAPRDHVWEGFVEFIPLDGGPTLRTERETTQPNREDLFYWATGLEPVYLEGAFERAFVRATEDPSV